MLFSLEKRKFRGYFIAVIQYSKGPYKKNGEKKLAGPVTIGQRVVVLN